MSLLNAETRTRVTLNIAKQILQKGLITNDEYATLERHLVDGFGAKISGLNLPKNT